MKSAFALRGLLFQLPPASLGVTRLTRNSAAETVTATMDILILLDPSMPRSVAFRIGTEFVLYSVPKDALRNATYFCDAYVSWQKGGIENANGRIRRCLTQQTDLENLRVEEIQDVAMTLNLVPRERLALKSPAEVLLNEFGNPHRIHFDTRVALRC